MLDDNAFYIGIFATILGSYFWLMFLRKRDRYEPEPLHALFYGDLSDKNELTL